MSEIIKVENVCLDFKQDDHVSFRALNHVSLKVKEKTFTMIVGPSGSGKSSLLYVMSGLLCPTSGNLSFQGTDLYKLPEKIRSTMRRQYFGFVFQQPFLFEYLSILENVLVPIPKISNEITEKAISILENVGLKEKMDKYPSKLSGGERQRAAIARALALEPKIVFADEPTAWLDRENRNMVIQLLQQYASIKTVVMVTHDLDLLAHANKVITIKDGSILNNENQEGEKVFCKDEPSRA